MTPRLVTRLTPLCLPRAIRARVGRCVLCLELGVLGLGFREQRVEGLLADCRQLRPSGRKLQLTFRKLVQLVLDREHARRILPVLTLLVPISLIASPSLIILTELIVAMLRSWSIPTHARLIRELSTSSAASSLRILLVLHRQGSSKLRIEVVL